jgi:predicted Zn-dependent protease with MMP-like domain
MRRRERERFDELFDDVLAELPAAVHRFIEECPIVLEDRPSRAILDELGMNDEDDLLCGLHTGVPLTERSVDRADLSDVIHLFREGIVDMAGGWEADVDEEGQPFGGEDAIRDEIRITILHEIGHHFGLDEGDLERLGYG